MITTIKTKEEIERILKECRWRALHFDKQGKSYFGKTILPSKYECAALISQWEKMIDNLAKTHPCGDVQIVDECGNPIFLYSNYSYSIPYPALTTEEK